MIVSCTAVSRAQSIGGACPAVIMQLAQTLKAEGFIFIALHPGESSCFASLIAAACHSCFGVSRRGQIYKSCWS